jgi:hypothetical protein
VAIRAKKTKNYEKRDLETTAADYHHDTDSH